MRVAFIIVIAALVGAAIGVGGTVVELGGLTPSVIDRLDTQSNGGASAEGAQPNVVVDNEEHDFGAMQRDTSRHHRFVFRNEGNAPLTLKDGGTSCSKCTVSTLTNTKIPPGGSADVEVNWTSLGPEGPYRVTATIETNDPKRRQITLVVQGKITTSHRTVPERIVWGSVPENEGASAEIRVFSFLSSDLQIVSHELSDPTTASFYDVAIEPIGEPELKQADDAKSGQLVKVTLKSGLPLGPIQQTIRLRLNLPEQPVVEVPIEGKITGAVTVGGHGWNREGEYLDLGLVESQAGAKANLSLMVRGSPESDATCKVEHVSVDELQVALGKPMKLGGGKITMIPVTIKIPKGARPANHLGSQQGKLAQVIIDTGVPAAGSVRLFVRYAVER